MNRSLNVLRVAFRLGLENDLLSETPVIGKLPGLKVRNELFSRSEIGALLPCLSELLRDFVLFGKSEGLAQVQALAGPAGA